MTERKEIESDLRATQDELIQTAKLAVVGQTMTTLAHEINQPLNALSMYLFTAGRAIEQGQSAQARSTLTKAEGLITRIDAIIRSLRQFARRAEPVRLCIRSISDKRSMLHGNCCPCGISHSRVR